MEAKSQEEKKVRTKRCCGCKQKLPATSEYFHKDKSKPDGLNGKCKQCMKAQNRKYYEQNKNELLLKARERKRVQKRKETRKRAWKNRHEKLARLGNDLTEKQWRETLEEFNYSCAYCGLEQSEEVILQKEHIVPVDQGGPITKWNIIPACSSCNASKANQELVDWYVIQPFYSAERLAKIVDFRAKYERLKHQNDDKAKNNKSDSESSEERLLTHARQQ